jgi:hypothetical protein
MAYRFPNDDDDDLNSEFDDAGIEIEEESDVPAADRNIEPLPKDLADELETLPDSEEYSKTVKNKFLQYKKVYHDERRLKEQAQREQNEALTLAQKILDENKRLKSLLKTGEEELLTTYKSAAELEVDKAKRRYKEAYDAGTTDEIVEAQQELIKANAKLDKATDFKPTMSDASLEASEYTLPKPAPAVDPNVAQWVKENPWYVDPSKKKMAKYALAVHEDLAETRGQNFVGSKAYFDEITKEVKQRFPEAFEPPATEAEHGVRAPSDEGTPKPDVVAPVRRSTSSKKVVLKTSQLAIAKKLGLTPEQYAMEVIKLEKVNV